MPSQAFTNDHDLSEYLIELTESKRYTHQDNAESLKQQLRDGEIDYEEFHQLHKQSYDQLLKEFDVELKDLTLSSDYTTSNHLSSIFPETHFDGTIKDFVLSAKHHTLLMDTNPIPNMSSPELTDLKSLEDITYAILNTGNDNIEYSDLIGRFIDLEITANLSSLRVEELAWYKLYQTILPKLSTDEQNAEIEQIKQSLDKGHTIDFAIKNQINKYQQNNNFPAPFTPKPVKSPKSLNYSTAAGGAFDVESVLPYNELIIIAANKLVDNQMERTQTVRHPMKLALQQHPTFKEISLPDTEVFDEFCRSILELKPFNESNLDSLKTNNDSLSKILQDPALQKELLDIYHSIHIYTFQTYTKPLEYTPTNVDKIKFKTNNAETTFGAQTNNPALQQIKITKLNELQATTQFMANNINNHMLEIRDTKHPGKQKSDSAGTLPDKQALTWKGTTNIINSYIKQGLPVFDATSQDNHPFALVATEMNRKAGSLVKKAAFMTVCLNQIADLQNQKIITPDEALLCINKLESEICPQGKTSKSSYFSTDVNMLKENIEQSSTIDSQAGTIDSQAEVIADSNKELSDLRDQIARLKAGK
jgi:hypothetical protein